MRQFSIARGGGLCLGALCLATATAVLAQNYPSRPIRLIIPYSPGGSTDIAGRLIAQEFTASLGQSVVVENRAGAAGNIGVDAVAHSAPDGYTLGLSGMGPSVLTHISGPKPGFTQKDLIFVGNAGLVEMMIVANPATPFATARQIIEAAKAAPGKMPYGHGGTGSPAHLAFELFKVMAGVQMPEIAYKGDTPTLSDLMGGQVAVASVSVAGAIGQIKAGKVRAVAVDSPQRSPALPDVPTLAETLPGYEAGTFNMLVAPSGTPAPVVQRLNAALNEAESKPALRERYAQMGMVPVIATPQQAADFVARETAKWMKVIKEANIQLQ
ncbi:MAG TPA: tripartite tricarboxylate transporter substrate binding protein [Burkholderiales bacterium]|nr:tripartite tricarboxylate transporter substrate binding protein [Burkholderiales bacterium]